MVRQIGGSVGLSGKNKPADVRTVQELLNDIPNGLGGPDKPVAVDGLIGPETIKAITRFQSRHFGWGDGRVDVDGKTLGQLNAFADATADGLVPPMPTKHGPKPVGGADPMIDNGGKKSDWGKVTSAVGMVVTAAGQIKSGTLVQPGIMLWTGKNSSAAVVMIKTGKTVYVPASSLLYVGQSYSTPLAKMQWSQNGAPAPAPYQQAKYGQGVSPSYFRQ